MFGFKDKTWCSQEACRNECGRQFKDLDRQDAIEWWGDTDFPIVVAEFCDDKGRLKDNVYGNNT